MARKKPTPIPTTSGDLNKDAFHKFLTAITNTKQRVADATTAHASEFKRCDALQIHPEALKLIQKLDRMGEEKRGNLLQAFDRYRTWMTWDAQLDLLETADEHDGAGADAEDIDDDGETVFSDDGEEERERGPAELTFASTDREEGDPMLEETAQAWGAADDQADNSEVYDRGGVVYHAGRDAGRAGKTADANEYLGEEADLWERGRIVGAKDFLASEAASIADEHEADEPATSAKVVNLFDEGGDGDEELPPAEMLGGGEGHASATAL
jgi:hypothetical protein